MWKVLRKNKKYDKRKLIVYKDNKKITEAYPFGGWYAMSERIEDEAIRMTCRSLILSELHWLIGKDCDVSEWIRKVNKLSSGKSIDFADFQQSVFFNVAEKTLAFLSFEK